MFQVEWVQSAFEQLAAIWTGGDPALREAVASAVRQAGQYLRLNPETQGESREENRRTFFVPPLGIDFRVEEEERKVVVLRVWLARKRKP